MKNNAICMRAIVLAAVTVLSGCSTHVSRDISPEGKAGEVIFPSLSSATLKDGIFPNRENLAMVKPGVTKDQLYHLLGRPHFREGFGGVREWDYLFHFNEGDGIRTCQYKVIFDRDYRGQSFHWLPADCASILAPRTAVAEPRPAPAAAGYSLGADALFAFGGSSLDSLSEEGRASLSRIAGELRNSQGAMVDIIAHTDRIGSQADNMRLSQARANTVRGYLVSQGVPQAGMRAIGIGASSPVKSCDDDVSRTALIACLAPNRRVEIRARANP